MSERISRVLHLLELLQSAGTRSLGELSGRLGVDERTVRRDVEQLRELEIPVESLRGRYGGYRIAAGYRMPPLMLTNDEALAVVLGLLHAQAAPGASAAAARSAMPKVRRSLPAGTARLLDALLRTASFADDAGPPGERSPAPDAGVLLTVADAVRERRPLEIRYLSAGHELSERTVHPYDVVAYGARWYLLALDTARDAERTFRVDRVRSVRALPGTFPPAPRSDDAARRLVDGFARADRAWRVVLRVRAAARHIRAHLPESVAVLTPLAGDDGPPWYRVEIRAARLDWLPPVIAALDRPVVVESPEELRTLLTGVAARLTAAATA